MTRNIYLTRRHPKLPDEHRIYKCNDAQAEFYDRVACALVEKQGVAPNRAQYHTDTLILKLLLGKEPTKSAPPAFHKGRRLFPTLTPEELALLPKVGPPKGEVAALILYLVHDQSGEKRAIRYNLDEAQRKFYRDAVQEIMREHGMRYEDAWFSMNHLVGALISGATVGEGADDLARMAVLLFPALSTFAAERLPPATEEDVERWATTL